MIKKLIIVTIIIVAGYGVWTYLQTIQQGADEKGDKLRQSERMLKEEP